MTRVGVARGSDLENKKRNKKKRYLNLHVAGSSHGNQSNLTEFRNTLFVNGLTGYFDNKLTFALTPSKRDRLLLKKKRKEK